MCNSVTSPRIASSETNLYFRCPFGEAETIIEFGIATNQTNICPAESKYGTINTDNECNLKGMGSNYTNFITDNFQKQCFGSVSCEFKFDNKYFSQKCLDKMTARQQKGLTNTIVI